MVSKQLLEVQRVLQDNGVLISFSGKLSQGLIEEYGEAVKKYLESEEKPKTDVFNTFSIFIEQTQNINNYCFSKENTPHYERIAYSSIITIGKEESCSYICCGNIIENNDVEPLISRLESIIHLDQSELKKLYKDLLKKELPPGSRSAGLGFIDIARKSSKKLEYFINKLDDELSFFTLKAVV